MKRAVLGAVVSAVAGFSLAGATLAANIQPAYWVPTMDRATQASYTVVDDGRGSERGDRPGDRRRGNGGARIAPAASPLLTASPSATPTPTYVIPTIPSELGIPGIVLQAYQQAADALATSDPGCKIDWATMAGVGKVESGHARNGRVTADGTTFEPILGPVLNGGGFAAIPDTDDGALDGDPVWDRAVGPMQFIPGTWNFIGADGNGDGVASPHNIFDAALSAGRYLCAGSRDLSVRPSLYAALLTYNHSDSYVALVLAWIDGYRAGHVTPLPPQDPPPTTATPTPTPTPTGTVPPTTTTPPTTAPTTTSPTPTSTASSTPPPTTRPPPSLTAPPTPTSTTDAPSEPPSPTEAPSSAGPSATETTPFEG